MRFLLFLVANAMLFIRPSELVPELHAVEIYRYFILACLAITFPLVLQQFSQQFTGVPPIAGCVLLLFPAVLLSGLMHGNVELLFDTLIEFAKIVIYFLLLIALLTDLAKLRQFLTWLGIFCAVVTCIAVLRYHADIALPGTTPTATGATKNVIHGTYVVDKVRDPETGVLVAVQRMCGTGIFNDPNDFALLLVTAIPLCLYWLTDPSTKATRPLWLAFLLLFGYALMLTHSRGGFLALIAGVVTLVHLRFGGAKTLLLGFLFLPILFVAFAGRMTNISAEDGTGQTRIQLWSDGLLFFQQSPLFGIGMENYRQFSRHVAHNSFIHSYAELGIVGGTLFLGAFYFALKGLYDLRAANDGSDPDTQRLHPYLSAMLVAYTVGICFLSRTYIVPTYLMLGLALVYLRLRAAEAEQPSLAWSRFVWPRLAGVSGGFLVFAYTFVRLFVHWR
jgi:O-antigen ligase